MHAVPKIVFDHSSTPSYTTCNLCTATSNSVISTIMHVLLTDSPCNIGYMEQP